MHKYFTLLGAALGAVLLSVTPVTTAWAEVSVGILAPRGELLTITHWAEFGKYLGQEIGQPVTIQPLSPPKVIPNAKDGRVNFVLSHAGHTVTIQEQFGGTVLATLNSKAGAQFAGVIVAKQGSGITQTQQLKGKNVMSLDKSAAGAYIFQAYHLMQKGIDPYRDLASFKEGKKQDDLILAVSSGLIDAAFVRTGVLENMAKEGKIKMSDFVIVDQRTDDGFPLVHTTQLYPEWYLTSIAGTPPELAQVVKAAALKLAATAPAAQAAEIKGFIEPLPLDTMKDALRALKLPPYDK
ncbi:PBPb domain-containing protein [Gammaproteobacteria bacterium]